jgi:hypothetical protein
MNSHVYPWLSEMYRQRSGVSGTTQKPFWGISASEVAKDHGLDYAAYTIEEDRPNI